MKRKLISLAVAGALAGARGLRAGAGLRAERRHRSAQGAAGRALGEDRAAREGADADEEDRRRDAGDCRQDRRRGRAGEIAPVVRRRRALPQRVVRRAVRRPQSPARSHPRAPQRELPRQRHDHRPVRHLHRQHGSALRQPDARPTRTRARISTSTWPTCTWAPNAQLEGHGRQAALSLAAHARSLFFDNDVNPEGIAVNYAKGNFFAGAFYDWLAERALSFSNVDHRHQHRLDHVRRAGRVTASRSRTASRLTRRRHLLQLRWRAGLQPAVRRQLVRQHDDDQRRGLQPHARRRHRLPAVRLRHHRRLRGPDRLGGRPAAALLRRLRAEHRSRSESGRAARSWTRRYARVASATAPPRRSRAPGNSVCSISRSRRTRCSASCVDSDFGDGNTDTNGYRASRRLHGRAQLDAQRRRCSSTTCRNDVPQSVTVFNEATPAPLRHHRSSTGFIDRDYKRLQLDLNFRF